MQVVIGIELGGERVDRARVAQGSKRACGPISHSAARLRRAHTRPSTFPSRCAARTSNWEFEAMLTLSAKPDEAEKK